MLHSRHVFHYLHTDVKPDFCTALPGDSRLALEVRAASSPSWLLGCDSKEMLSWIFDFEDGRSKECLSACSMSCRMLQDSSIISTGMA